MVSPRAWCVFSPQQLCGDQLSTGMGCRGSGTTASTTMYVKSHGLWAIALAFKEFLFFLGKTDAHTVVILRKQVQNVVRALKAELPFWTGEVVCQVKLEGR